MNEQEQKPEAPPAPQSDHEVLVEIRDLLRELLKRYPAVSYTRPQGLTG